MTFHFHLPFHCNSSILTACKPLKKNGHKGIRTPPAPTSTAERQHLIFVCLWKPLLISESKAKYA